MDFKGFDDWIEIFRGGQQIDSQGREHDGDAIIARAASTFDASKHEPPVVVGHPKDNGPAYGWVEGLKTGVKNGAAVLLAKFKQVAPELAALVQEGRFKKRSASFYPDGRLRHVGFLGAAPPAVKGLADLKFEEGEAATFEFSYTSSALDSAARLFRGLRDWLIESAGAEKADRLLPEWEVQNMHDAIVHLEPETQTAPALAANAFAGGKEAIVTFKERFKTLLGQALDKIPDADLTETVDPKPAVGFTEADVATAVKKAADEARKQVEAEFSEKAKKAAAETRKQEIANFIDQGVKAGKIAPAWTKAGLKEFMQGLDGEAVVEFAEGKKLSAAAWFREFLEGLPKLVEFGEIATRDKDVSGGDAGGKLEALTQAKIKANKNLTYSAAFAEVQIEHPDLAAEYRQSPGKEA